MKHKTLLQTSVKIGIITFIVISFIGITAAQDLNEDFEDGDITVDSPGWDGWNGDTDGFRASSDNPINGSFSGTIEGKPSDPTHSVQTSSAGSPLKSLVFYMRVNKSITGGTGDGVTFTLQDSEGTRLIRVFFSPNFDTTNKGEIYVGSIRSSNRIIEDYDANAVYKFTFSDINFDTHTFDVTVEGAGETNTFNDDSFQNAVDDFGGIAIGITAQDGTLRSDVDNIIADTGIETYTISGNVINRDHEKLDNIDIVTNKTQSTTTDNGKYSLFVRNGTYKVTAGGKSYANQTEIVVVKDSDVTQDFKLTELDDTFTVDINPYMKHGSTQPYKAIYLRSNDAGVTAIDVTDSITIDSSNSSVVSIDESNNILQATSDKSVAERITITANYTNNDGENYEISQNVTVANRTMDNIHLMPGSQYVQTFLGVDEDQALFGIGSEIQWIFLAILFGSVLARFKRSEWLGIGVITFSLIIFWLLGNVSVGITMQAILFAITIALILIDVPSRFNQHITIENIDESE